VGGLERFLDCTGKIGAHPVEIDGLP